MTQFNSEQQKAIDILGRNVVVSASAGAGKTTVLIARLMKRILQDGISLDEIVALTFTEAAAKEMKNRLLEALYSVKRDEFLEKQISLVETASITTIHAFCLNIIQNYGYILRLNPDRSNNVMDDTQVALFQEEAFQSVLEQRIAHHFEATKQLLNTFSPRPLDTASFKTAIYAVYRWINGNPEPKQSIAELKKSYQSHEFKQLPDKIQELFFDMYFTQLHILRDGLKELMIMSGSYLEEDKKYQKMYEQMNRIHDTITELDSIIEMIQDRDIHFYEKLLAVLNFTMEPDGAHKAYSALRKTIEKQVNNLVSYLLPLSEKLSITSAQLPLIKTLIDFALDFKQAYEALKEERNTLDFDDFEHFAYQILTQRKGEIAKIYQNELKEIMIDEFQDTSTIQNEIIIALSNGHNIFRVGDVKQSIYRFRGAKPDIMQALLKDPKIEKLFLRHNYRSKKSIVDFNNHVFDSLFNLSFGMTYDANDYVNIGIEKQEENNMPVELHFIETQDIEDIKTSQLYAWHIAQEMIYYHKQGFAFRDMVVLVRSHAQKTYLRRAFERFNIPHYLDDHSGFYQSIIIVAVKSFLNYALTYDPYYLPDIFLSPFFALDYDDLARFKLTAPSFEAGIPKTILDDLHGLIHEWQHMDIVSIIQSLIHYKNAYQKRFSIQDRTNMDLLLEKAQLFSKNYNPSLTAFIRYLDFFDDDTSSEASPLSPEDDVVTALTIHQSKGLQYPLVFVWSMGKHQVKENSEFLLTDDYLGIALKHIDLPYRIQSKTLFRELWEYSLDRQTLEENLRLLYVALTRAQNHLILVSSTKEYEALPFNMNLFRNHETKQALIASVASDQITLKIIRGQDLKEEKLELNLEEQSVSFNNAYYDQIPLVPSSLNLPLEPLDEAGLSYGTAIHEAIENLPHRLWEDDDLKHYETMYHRALSRYNQNPFTQSLYEADIYHELAYLNEASHGIIDFLAIFEDRIVIVDFKSDTLSPEQIRQKYSQQILRYKEAIHGFYPEYDVSAYIYSFHHHCYIPVIVNP